jgi:hypothetical protein
MHEKNVLVAVLVVLVIMLVLNSDMCRNMLGRKGCGCRGSCRCGEKMSGKNKSNASNVSNSVREAFSSRPYNYNRDTVGKGVSWQSDQLDKDHVMSHEDYIRSVGIDKSTVENHREWYEDPNIKPYYGSNFNLRSDYEPSQLVPTVGLRRRPTRVPIGVSSRQVPDIDERDYAEDTQLGIGNFVGGFDNKSGY